MTRARGLAGLAPALLGFWVAYFAIVALSNLADLLRGLGVLPGGWPWVSGNLALVTAATGKLGVPPALAAGLLAGVVLWEALAAALFARAAGRPPSDAALAPPFLVSLGLWGVFVLLDGAARLRDRRRGDAPPADRRRAPEPARDPRGAPGRGPRRRRVRAPPGRVPRVPGRPRVDTPGAALHHDRARACSSAG